MLQINNGVEVVSPLIVGEITWETLLKGAPGKLTFKVLPDEKLNFQEGNGVTLQVGEKKLFKGYVFTKSRDKENIISVTAYDQLRYLKNKDRLAYENLKTNDLINLIAQKFNLKTGDLDNTEYPISRIESNTSLFDMIQTSLDITLQNKRKYYVMFDDYGKICLKNIETMRMDAYLDRNNIQNYDYCSSIDSSTYTQVKLMREDKDSGGRDFYIVQDTDLIKQWGLLQYFEKVDGNTDPIAKANALMELHKNKERTLNLKGVLGDVAIRAGNSLMISINGLGDIDLHNNMILTRVRHVFKNEEHRMDLQVKGGVING